MRLSKIAKPFPRFHVLPSRAMYWINMSVCLQEHKFMSDLDKGINRCLDKGLNHLLLFRMYDAIG